MTKNVVGKIVLLVTSLLSVVAWYVSYANNYVLTYNDAASHLNISRRVVDSLTPGFAQIGTVWLPLPHVLMLPLAWNDFMWHTGFAGSIVSMIAFVASVYFIFKLVVLITENVWAGVVGAAVMALNPNFLYLQTTPMTEPMLVMTIVISLYFLAKYLKSNAINDLILCGTFVSASTLVRYDGWFLFICLSVMLPVWVWALWGRRRAESNTILFMCAGGFGIFLWVMWNKIIFGDPLYFMRGPYSAAAQQKVLKSVDQLPTQGDLFVSSFYYMWSIIDNNGMWLSVAGLAGTLLVPFLMKNRRMALIVLGFFSIIAFNVIALYLGQSAMNVPQAPKDPGMFNIRYGLMALPALALVLGIISVKPVLRYVVMALLVVQTVLFLRAGIPVSLADGLDGLKNTYYTVEASRWLRENYKGGLILTSLASHDAFVARAQLPMRHYIHEGTREYWDNALEGPNRDVQYVALLTFPPDSVYRKLRANPAFNKNYKVVHRYGKFEIYHRTN